MLNDEAFPLSTVRRSFNMLLRLSAFHLVMNNLNCAIAMLVILYWTSLELSKISSAKQFIIPVTLTKWMISQMKRLICTVRILRQRGTFQKGLNKPHQKYINTFINNDKGYPSKKNCEESITLWRLYKNIMKIYEADTSHIKSRNRSTLNKETSTNPSVLFSMIYILQPEAFLLTCLFEDLHWDISVLSLFFEVLYSERKV